MQGDIDANVSPALNVFQANAGVNTVCAAADCPQAAPVTPQIATALGQPFKAAAFAQASLSKVIIGAVALVATLIPLYL